MGYDRTSKDLGRAAGLGIFLGLAVVLALFVLGGIVSYLNTRTLRQDSQAIMHTHDVLLNLADVVSLAKDAETGQRGFLITGDEHYIEPYTIASGRIHLRIEALRDLTQDNAKQQARIPELEARVNAKLTELQETIELRRSQDFEAARKVVLTDRGKVEMDGIRAAVETMQQEELRLRDERIDEMAHAYTVSVVSGVLTGVTGALFSFAVAYLLWRLIANRRQQEWLQSAQIALSKITAGEQRLDQLSDNTLRFLAESLDAQVGAFFSRDGDAFHRTGAYGLPAGASVPEKFERGDSLLAQAAQDNRTFAIHNVPDNYLALGSSLGRSKPRNLLIVPISDEGEVNAVIELGFLQAIDRDAAELFERVSETIGVAIRSVKFRAHLQNLLEETQRQSEELQSQGEELRVSNEELEEQGRALRESQGRLENQQAELEETNAQLEEQTQLLEAQRDEITRAKETLETRAQELDQASRYKSDFLANMSHELRTPLNSSLILAKLLADNASGNLTEEQVKYAATIESAGNDLLALINDILDLSKIEAGHMEMRLETIGMKEIVDDLNRVFAPMAEYKGLEFRIEIFPGCPDSIETDKQRLEQILKNLLSNALKFTEHGKVELAVSRAGDGRVAFAVSDTGIGVSPEQQSVIFEAFRQADGTTNRKYDGTGLGLSISRELARLLGGEIQVTSKVGSGSLFTVAIPEVFDARLVRERTSPSVALNASSSAAINDDRAANAELEKASSAARARRVPDDRERLSGDGRVILVVEDDESFARILYDLVHESQFQCLVASTAEEGFAMAVQYSPSAMVLDVGLPDHTGMWVLDRLKHDRRMRHIPVHVISAHDYAQTALSLGAVGYLLKPVKREQLATALEQIEHRFSQRMRRVLVVEDDAVQLDSVQRLLGSKDVKTVGVSTAAECLEQLKGSTFDCMVLDLSLPDSSGHALLETLSREDSYSFPPVIVYTGRDLLADEEQQLRRYSKSIIIKGAKSPERLLDEVTLFLHQVVSDLPAEQQRMLEKARSRDAAIEGRRILVVEDDVRNVFALTSILEPRGASVQIARNGREALEALEKCLNQSSPAIDLVLMDVMMPEMDGITATREIRKQLEWKKLPIIMLTAKVMKDDQEQCLAAGANDYMAKPLDIEKLLSLVRVWMPR